MSDITFGSLALLPQLQKGLAYLKPLPLSPIEEQVIPPLLRHEAVVAISPTGTGKTLSYLLPIVNDILQAPDNTGVQAIIVVPTIILGLQIETVMTRLLKESGYKGSKPVFYRAVKEMHGGKKNPCAVIITPPLLKELTKTADLTALSRLVFDEGDMILFDGFGEEMVAICSALPKAQKSFFSASLGPQHLTLVKRLCKATRVIDLSDGRINGSNIKHVLVDLRGLTRGDALTKIITDPALPPGPGLIFVAKKAELRAARHDLEKAGVAYALAAGDFDARTLNATIRDFMAGKVKLLLATDYASRGLDLPTVAFVISYTLPDNTDYYFHRAGRSGRFDRPGVSFVLCDRADLPQARALQRRGAGFTFMAMKKEGLVLVTAAPKAKRVREGETDYVKKAVIKAKRQYPKTRVKPGYKKKIKTAVIIAKSKHKNKIIRTNLHKNKKDLKHGV